MAMAMETGKETKPPSDSVTATMWGSVQGLGFELESG
jgi:hypothetical protein